jgi:SHS2 domain-containing protein
MKPYEFKDHTADIIARANGATLTDAFAAAAQAMFDVITGGAQIAGELAFEFEVESIDREGLLVGFLSDLIVINETENVVLGKFEIELIDNKHLRATVRGERFNPEKHGEGTQVKGISYHLMEISNDCHQGTWTVQVLFDV